MAIKVGINGFGRIGRVFMRSKLKYDTANDIDIVGVNDIADSKTLAYLLKYDSVYGVLDADVNAGDDSMVIDGKKIMVSKISDPALIPWKDLGAEVVIESTGIFRTKEAVQKHFDAGARKVIVSAPMKGGGADII